MNEVSGAINWVNNPGRLVSKLLPLISHTLLSNEPGHALTDYCTSGHTASLVVGKPLPEEGEDQLLHLLVSLSDQINHGGLGLDILLPHNCSTGLLPSSLGRLYCCLIAVLQFSVTQGHCPDVRVVWKFIPIPDPPVELQSRAPHILGYLI